MKKLVTVVTMIMMMAVSGMCFAAGDGSALNKQQKVVDRFTAVLAAPSAAAVTQLQAEMVPDLAEKMTAANIAALQKQMQEKFGNQKEATFAAFERFDQGDRLTYIVSYSREKLVRAVYGFNKEGKLNEFVFVPMEIKEEQK